MGALAIFVFAVFGALVPLVSVAVALMPATSGSAGLFRPFGVIGGGGTRLRAPTPAALMTSVTAAVTAAVPMGAGRAVPVPVSARPLPRRVDRRVPEPVFPCDSCIRIPPALILLVLVFAGRAVTLLLPAALPFL